MALVNDEGERQSEGGGSRRRTMSAYVRAEDPVFQRLLSTFASELARWKDKVAQDPGAVLSVEHAAAAAFDQLIKMTQTHGRTPALTTVRTVLEANIFRLDPGLSPADDDVVIMK
jgi:hypothetical protein